MLARTGAAASGDGGGGILDNVNNLEVSGVQEVPESLMRQRLHIIE
jgi:hypothetical protein